jgi:light-regulated signal transduction histidine kinase (bacteriophytochrome)
VARGIVQKLERSQPERKVSFVAEEGVVAEGDASLLRVALENLLGNAWKFTSKKEVATIEFGAAPYEGGDVAYYVRDDGAGFDPRYAEKLFGAFQRLHGAEDFEGTGIGLATVARIVHRHGGRVWAEGAVGEGATFFFTLKQ